MNERAPTVKEQAARMILGEIAPLVEKLDEVATIINESHQHLADDVRQIAAVVTVLENTVKSAAEQFGYLTSQARTVQAEIARFQSAPAPKAKGPLSPMVLGALMVGAALIAAAIATGAVLVIERGNADHARIGRAVSRAYPNLDDSTRQKLDAALQKARD